jgi:hypothetical protein
MERLDESRPVTSLGIVKILAMKQHQSGSSAIQSFENGRGVMVKF